MFIGCFGWSGNDGSKMAAQVVELEDGEDQSTIVLVQMHSSDFENSKIPSTHNRTERVHEEGNLCKNDQILWFFLGRWGICSLFCVEF